MNIRKIINRPCPPPPWGTAPKLPWDDPAFSRRMLQEHLSQDHDLASRRLEIIDRQVHWIHEMLLAGRPSRVLDLGCGPGLYLERLARLGHNCVGIDFSPASIAYARGAAERGNLPIRYVQGDLRSTDFEDGFDLIMMLWGEFNTFTPDEGRTLLRKCAGAAADGGQLLLEVHLLGAVERQGTQGTRWSAHETGLFSEAPHLCLEESFWDEGSRVATTRFYILGDDSSAICTYASTTQGYTDEAYRDLLLEAGYSEVTTRPSIGAKAGGASEAVTVFLAKMGDSPPILPRRD